jgi:hypothetical protein
VYRGDHMLESDDKDDHFGLESATRIRDAVRATP